MENSTIIIFSALLLYLDVMALFYAHKSDMFERSQLIIQAAIVILIPFIGGIFILMFSLSQINQHPLPKEQEKTKSRILYYLFLSFALVDNSSGLGHGASESSSDHTGGDGGSDD